METGATVGFVLQRGDGMLIAGIALALGLLAWLEIDRATQRARFLQHARLAALRSVTSLDAPATRRGQLSVHQIDRRYMA